MRARESILLVLILFVYAISLSRTSGYEFVWDDVPEIAVNPAFDRPLLDGLKLTQVERGAPELADLSALQFGYDSYRPLTFASYWLDIHAFGRAPGPLHVVNVVLGAIGILLAYLLARRIVGPPHAWIAVAIFALHPLQVEAVAYVSARSDLLAGIFVFLSAYACVRAHESEHRARYTSVAALAFAASLLSKEAYVAFPVVVAGMALLRRARWSSVVALCGVAVVVLSIRTLMISTESRMPLADALLALPGRILEYARIIAMPFDLSIERQTQHIYMWIGWALVIIAIALMIYMWRRRVAVTDWMRAALVGLLWFVVLLAPSTIAISTMRVVADRYAYAPLLGFSIAATALGTHVAGRSRRLRVVLVVTGATWAALLGAVAWRQVAVWRNPSTLYRHAVELAPDSASAHYRVAHLELVANRWDLALPHLEAAIALDPRYTPALNNLGVFYLRSGRHADAEAHFARALEANPGRFNTWFNMGLAQLAQGRRDVGCTSIRRALEINPRFVDARHEYARSCATALP